MAGLPSASFLMRIAALGLNGLLFVASLAVVVAVHNINRVNDRQRHPLLAKTVSVAPEEDAQVKSLSTLDLLRRDPPSNQGSAGVLSLQQSSSDASATVAVTPSEAEGSPQNDKNRTEKASPLSAPETVVPLPAARR